jgi:hypothetical protein
MGKLSSTVKKSSVLVDFEIMIILAIVAIRAHFIVFQSKQTVLHNFKSIKQ